MAELLRYFAGVCFLVLQNTERNMESIGWDYGHRTSNFMSAQGHIFLKIFKMAQHFVSNL
jgi:hypothetical protein